MNGRLVLAARQMLRPRVMTPVVRSMSGYGHDGHDHHKVVGTYDELPFPEGSWQEHHSREQRAINLKLLASIVALFGTLAITNKYELIDWHMSYPEIPEDF